jgi:hypothetical protein
VCLVFFLNCLRTVLSVRKFASCVKLNHELTRNHRVKMLFSSICKNNDFINKSIKNMFIYVLNFLCVKTTDSYNWKATVTVNRSIGTILQFIRYQIYTLGRTGTIAPEPFEDVWIKSRQIYKKCFDYKKGVHL